MKALLTIVILLAAFICRGQFIPMTNTIRTPYGNVTYTSYQPSPMHYGNSQISMKYEFTVVLLDDSTVTDKTRIDITQKQHQLVVKTRTGKNKYTPGLTKEIYRITPSGYKLKGIPADSCWLFSAVKGKINAYSYLAEEKYDYVIAIQDGNDAPIVPLTKKNLEQMVGTTDPKILKLIAKGQLIKALRTYNSLPHNY